MRKIKGKCGCLFEAGAWHSVQCEHGLNHYPTIDGFEYEPIIKPKVICLCGSTRFYDEFQKANFDLTMKGYIVLSLGFYPHSAAQGHGGNVGISEDQKQDLDILHFRKIDMADEVLIINPGGYIGKSAANELAYARNMGKRIWFLSPGQRLHWDEGADNES